MARQLRHPTRALAHRWSLRSVAVGDHASTQLVRCRRMFVLYSSCRMAHLESEVDHERLHSHQACPLRLPDPLRNVADPHLPLSKASLDSMRTLIWMSRRKEDTRSVVSRHSAIST